MLLGVPKEIKSQEYRVGLTPAGVRELAGRGHRVFVQAQAGVEAGFSDELYRLAGAEVVDDVGVIFARAELIIKVKEPQEQECSQFHSGQALFTYLHLAAAPKQAQLLLAAGVTGIAYETVTDSSGGLPLLLPMSEVAGRLAVQAGARFLEKPQGGPGILLGGVTGVAPAKVVIIGGGVVGSQAARVAIGLGADVTLLDKSLPRLRQLAAEFGSSLRCVYASSEAIESYALSANLIIGAVLIPGAAAPKVLSHDIIRRMQKGTVIVDVAIDQGGCFATSRPTTHEQPVYDVDGVIHYCVTNMPSGAARTATEALTNATLPYILAMADKGVAGAMLADEHLRRGLNLYAGQVTSAPVAKALGYAYCSAESLLSSGS